MNWNYDTSGRVQDVVYSTGMSATGAYVPSVPMGWSVTEFDGAGRRVLVKPYKMNVRANQIALSVPTYLGN
ncbi:MAG: hypothetical protein ABL962_04975 [Fimbriimonadaceae bacterium]